MNFPYNPALPIIAKHGESCPDERESLGNFVCNYLSWSRTILLSFCLSCSVSLVLWEDTSSNSVNLQRYFHRLKYNFNKTNYRQTTLNNRSVIKQPTNNCKTHWNSYASVEYGHDTHFFKTNLAHYPLSVCSVPGLWIEAKLEVTLFCGQIILFFSCK